MAISIPNVATLRRDDEIYEANAIAMAWADLF